MNRVVLFVGLCLLGKSVLAKPLPTEQPGFHLVVAVTYAFQPHTLTQEQIVKRSGELDAIWEGVKANPDSYLPLLRAELARADRSPFFSYDGSKLLLSLSKSRSDKELALKAMELTDLRDLQPDDYLRTVHRFAVEEFDTTALAFKILSNAGFKVFVPAHALTLGQDYSLVYMLLPTKEEFYLARAAKRLESETEVSAQKSLLRLLAYTVTREGDRAIEAFAKDVARPRESRELAASISETRAPEASVLAKAQRVAGEVLGVSQTYCGLKAVRRKRLASVSDEALIDLDLLTVAIRAGAWSSAGCS